MAEIRKYIYGITDSNASLHFSIQEDFLLGRRESDEVYAIRHEDVSALVRDSELPDYTGMCKETLARLLVNHQMVIETIMAPGDTIIPMRLGTFGQDETEVKDILNRGYNLIKEIFGRIRGKMEIDVATIWTNFSSTVKEVSEEKEIKEFKEKLLANRKGITVDDQMKVGFMLKQALDKRREEYAQEILSDLKSVSLDSRPHELMDEKMVVNTAFLIDRDRRDEFDRKIEELNARFDEELNFRCVGPLPPYSFCTLEIKKLEFEEIDWARKKLKLFNDSVTKGEIKKAHHRLALLLHPDKNPDTPGIEKEFDEVTKAYNVLWEYCEKDSCSFKEDEVKKSGVLVKIRG